MRDTLLTIHILGAGVWIGTNVMGFIVNPQINPAARVIASDHWHHTVVGFKRYLYMPAYLIVLITGVLLVTAVDGSPYEMSDTFVMIGFLGIFVAVLSGIYFARQGRKVAAAYDADDKRTAASIEQRIAGWSLVDTAVIVMTMGTMVSKLGAF
jgi:uncharacterized membrane protein